MGDQKLTRLRRDLWKRGRKGEAFINNYLILNGNNLELAID